MSDTKPPSCLLCPGKILDPLCHTCKRGCDVTTRHNRLRNAIYKVLLVIAPQFSICMSPWKLEAARARPNSSGRSLPKVISLIQDVTAEHMYVTGLTQTCCIHVQQYHPVSDPNFWLLILVTTWGNKGSAVFDVTVISPVLNVKRELLWVCMLPGQPCK